MRTVNSIADLRTQTGMTANELAIVLGYYEPGDGGGGDFYWNPTSTEVVNVGTIFAPTAGPATGRWKRIYDGAINVKWFGVKGDQVADDTADFQAAYDYAASNTNTLRTTQTLFIPAGTYQLMTLRFNKFLADLNVIGEGMRKTVFLGNSTSTDGILRIGADDNQSRGKLVIQGITFYGKGTSPCLLNMINARYTTVQLCEFAAPAAGTVENPSKGIWTNHWSNRLLDNEFFFNDPDTQTEYAIGIHVDTATGTSGPASAGSINGLNVMLNNINGAWIGLWLGGGSENLVNISNNVIDQCFGTGIYSRGCRKINITNNYIEACGDVGLSIDRNDGNPPEMAYGSIIVHGLEGNQDSHCRGMVVRDNMFAVGAGPTKPVITLSHIVDFVAEGNKTYYDGEGKYKHDSFVELRWAGVLSTGARNIVIDHVPMGDDQFNQLVKFNTDSNIYLNRGNIVIKDYKTQIWNKRGNLPVFNDPMSWPSSTSWTSFYEDEPYEGYWKVDVIPGSTVTTDRKTLTLNLESTAGASSLKGAYYRVYFKIKSGTASVACIDFRIFFDGVEAYAFTTTSVEWASGVRGFCFQIPETCSELKFTLGKVTGQDTYITQFSIMPASLPLDHPAAAVATRHTNGVYRGAGTPEGKVTANIGRLCIREDGASGTALYVKTSGTGKTGWKPVVTG